MQFILIRFIVLIGLCLGCGPLPGKVSIPQPRLIPTEPLPLATFTAPSFALSQSNQAPCQAIETFFRDYTHLAMPSVTGRTSCQEVFGSIYTPEELKELRYQAVDCDLPWRCFKTLWELEKNDQKDRFFVLVVQFDEDNARGLIAGSYLNRSLLPRSTDQLVYASQLIDEGLAPLIGTFDNWLENIE